LDYAKDEEDLTILAQKQKNENTSMFGSTIISFGKLNCLLKNNHIKKIEETALMARI
jgi:hypothetical protein